MRIESLKIKQGLFECVYEFCSTFNLVFSRKNSVGKTSLLRLLMYSLGYAIPSTQGLNFQKFELYAEITDDHGKTILLYRNQDFMTVTADGNESGYSLPNDLHTVHAVVFGIQNHQVLDNLLGTFYIDQEKGWTLLNRGKAIGNNQFTIENLVLGLSDRACDDLEERLTAVRRELKKYKQMFDTAQYQTQLNELGENIVFDNENEELQKKFAPDYGERAKALIAFTLLIAHKQEQTAPSMAVCNTVHLAIDGDGCFCYSLRVICSFARNCSKNV